MADTKISALTAATTPLAGTEVLPIVQSGTTKQVSVANLTAGRAVSADSLTLTGLPLPATSGGTGQSSYAVGDLLYASTTTALSKLADVATGNALISGGVGVAPSWGKIGLTTHVSGTLPIANGGTAKTSFTAGQLLYGSFSQSSGLYYDGTNLGLGTSSPTSNANKTTLTVDNATWGGVFEMAVGGTVHGRWAWSTGGYTTFGTVMNEALQFVANNTTVSTLFPSGGFSIGNTTDPGASNLSVTGRTYSKIGSNTITNGSTQTLFTLGTGDVYIVNCSFANFSGGTTTAIVWLPQSGNTSYSGAAILGQNFTTFTLSVSGANVQITNNVGASVTYYWSAIKLY